MGLRIHGATWKRKFDVLWPVNTLARHVAKLNHVKVHPPGTNEPVIIPTEQQQKAMSLWSWSHWCSSFCLGFSSLWSQSVSLDFRTEACGATFLVGVLFLCLLSWKWQKGSPRERGCSARDVSPCTFDAKIPLKRLHSKEQGCYLHLKNQNAIWCSAN